ncbi:site-specific integrase [Clostridium estertheticum]|nr:site-specific integrase [Clostridium estertheticum]
MVSVKIKGRSKYTLKSYYYHNRYFMRFIGEDTLCNTINQQTLENYIVYMQDKKGLTNGVTLNSYLSNISPTIKFGVRRGYLNDFDIPQVKYQETFKEIYTPGELIELLTKPNKKDFVTIRTWCMIWTFASTGLRATELRELRIKNVDMFNKTIAVNITKNKKARYLHISNSLSEVLTEYMELRSGESDDYLFPTVYGDILAQSTLQKCIKNFCNERGIEKCSLHLFRHTFITNAVNQNVSPLILQKITGHSTMKELSRYYNAKTIDMVNIIDGIAPSLKSKKSLYKNKK